MTKKQEISKLEYELEEAQREKRKHVISAIWEAGFSLLLILLFKSDRYDKFVKEAILDAYRNGSNPGAGMAGALEFFQKYGPVLMGVFGLVCVIISLVNYNKAEDEIGRINFELMAKQAELKKETSSAKNAGLCTSHTWVCTCGRELDKSVSSCICGMSQREIRMQTYAQQNKESK